MLSNLFEATFPIIPLLLLLTISLLQSVKYQMKNKTKSQFKSESQFFIKDLVHQKVIYNLLNIYVKKTKVIQNFWLLCLQTK